MEATSRPPQYFYHCSLWPHAPPLVKSNISTQTFAALKGTGRPHEIPGGWFHPNLLLRARAGHAHI